MEIGSIRCIHSNSLQSPEIAQSMNNPYKRTRKVQEADRKRAHRPWESTNAAPICPLRATASTPCTQQPVYRNNQPMPSRNVASKKIPPAQVIYRHNDATDDFDCGIDWGAALQQQQPVHQPGGQPVTFRSVTSVPSTAVPQNFEATDDFDCGIDWDAALKTLEDQSVFDATTSTTTTRPTTTATTSSSQHTILSKDGFPKPSGDVVKKDFPIFDKNRSNGLHHQSSSSMKGHGQPKENTNENQINSIGSALSDLRPAAWNGPPTTKLPPSNNNTEVLCDPDQQGLPTQLQFTKKDVAPVRDEYQRDLVKHAAIHESLLNGWTLYGHQKRAILKALAMRRCILALDMGLGKTLIGCVWAKAFVKTMQTHVIVLCPVTLQEEWKRTMENTAGLVVQDLNGASKKKVSKENAAKMAASPTVSIHSWSKIPSQVEETYGDYVVICDEAHSIQSMQSARTRDTLKLAAGTLCEGVLMLTGTPMKNGKPSNLFPLLKAVNHPLGRHQKAYEAHFCAGREVNFGRGKVWQATGAANLEQLHKLTKTHMLHLTKETCLKDLPPLSRTFVSVPVSSRRQMQHNHALQELARIYETKRSSGPDDKLLGAVQKVRMMGSLAKVEAAVEKAKTILLEQPAIVIFTSFQEVAKQVHRQLAEAGWTGELLTGKTPAEKRQAMVDNFQKGLSSVFCCTFGAGGVGLTLTAAHSVILLDRPWTPGDAHQAEDRVRRIGQTMPVTSIWLRAFGLDKQIDDMIVQKSQTANAVLAEGSAKGSGSNEQQSAPRISIFQMLKSILPAGCDGMTQTSILQFSQQED